MRRKEGGDREQRSTGMGSDGAYLPGLKKIRKEGERKRRRPNDPGEGLRKEKKKEEENKEPIAKEGEGLCETLERGVECEPDEEREETHRHPNITSENS